MKKDDFEWRRRSKTSASDDDNDDEILVVPRFGFAVLLLAALALGALRRRLTKFHQQADRQRYSSESYGPGPRVVWRVWREVPSGTESNAWRFRRTHQFWDEYIEEELRKERIRRMQEAFHQERARYGRGYERWHEQPGDRVREKPYLEAELKAAFRAKAKEHHPDRNPTRRAEAQQKFVEVVQSYEVLRESLKHTSK